MTAQVNETVVRDLILKAARRLDEDRKDSRYNGLVANIRINAFAEVAADVLRIAMTPFAFTNAIEHALCDFPLPRNLTLGRERAAAERASWEAAFSAAVLAVLS